MPKSDKLTVQGKPMLYAPMSSLHSAASEAATRLLFVEDDRAVSQLLVEVLEETGFTACAATSAAEMDRVLERENIDLIVLDVMLPGGEDGFSICLV